MKTFINANSYISAKDDIRESMINHFIELFNHAIKNSFNKISLNNGLSDVGVLNDKEFEYCVAEAEKQGWKLTRFEDNYQTITYKLEKI